MQLSSPHPPCPAEFSCVCMYRPDDGTSYRPHVRLQLLLAMHRVQRLPRPASPAALHNSRRCMATISCTTFADAYPQFPATHCLPTHALAGAGACTSIQRCMRTATLHACALPPSTPVPEYPLLHFGSPLDASTASTLPQSCLSACASPTPPSTMHPQRPLRPCIPPPGPCIRCRHTGV